MNIDALLKEYVSESLDEAPKKVSASQSYMKKERVRERVQSFLKDLISESGLKSDEELQVLLGDINLSLTALKMIPLSVWKKM